MLSIMEKVECIKQVLDSKIVVKLLNMSEEEAREKLVSKDLFHSAIATLDKCFYKILFTGFTMDGANYDFNLLAIFNQTYPDTRLVLRQAELSHDFMERNGHKQFKNKPIRWKLIHIKNGKETLMMDRTVAIVEVST